MDKLDMLLEHIAKITQDMAEMKSDMVELRKSVAHIEHDHGEKLTALFDGQKQHTEILNRHTEILNRHTEQLECIENKIVAHDVQISVLDRRIAR